MYSNSYTLRMTECIVYIGAIRYRC